MGYEKPKYTVVIVTKNGTKYYIKGSGSATQVTGLTLKEAKGELAQKAVIKIMNLKVGGNKGGYPSNLFPVKSKVFIYAKGAGKSKNTEVFRGFVWENKYTNKTKKEVTLTCYDNLIYFMNSEINMFFSKGKSTKSIISTICRKWGIKLDYSYEQIKHPKLPLSGSIADVLTGRILKKVKDKKDKRYVIRSVKGVMHIKPVGKNSAVYVINKSKGGTEIGYTKKTTMKGMVTKVVIAGKTNSAGKTKIESTVRKNTKQYGTLQKVIHKEDDTKLKDAKEEARVILREKAKPKKTYDDVAALDIPWIKKGDKVGVCFSGSKITYCIVMSIKHNVKKGTMVMDLIDA